MQDRWVNGTKQNNFAKNRGIESRQVVDLIISWASGMHDLYFYWHHGSINSGQNKTKCTKPYQIKVTLLDASLVFYLGVSNAHQSKPLDTFPTFIS